MNNKMVDREDVNNIVKGISKVIKQGIKDGKKSEDIICSKELNKFIGTDRGATGDANYTTYDILLGKYFGKVTKTNLAERGAKEEGCKKIDVKDAGLSITINHDEDDSIDIDLYVQVDWMNKWGSWNIDDYVTLKTWKVVR